MAKKSNTPKKMVQSGTTRNASFDSVNESSTNDTINGKSDLPVDVKVFARGIKDSPREEYNIDGYEMLHTVEMGSDRSINAEKIELKGENLGQLVFSDGTEWLGYVGDLKEIYPKEKKRGTITVEDDMLFSSVAPDGNRSFLGTAAVKLLNIFKPKAAVHTASFIAKKADEKVMPNPGVYLLDADFRKSNLEANAVLEGKILLLIHGTLSSTDGSFGDLKGDNWKAIHKMYQHVIALDHYTLSQTPIENALELLQSIPANIEIDIISHSRGGLIGDVLSRCDRRNAIIGFSEEEIDILKRENEELESTIQQLNLKAKKKGIIINKFVRVACPAKGTTLLSKRLDHFLNALLNTLGWAIGGKANLIYTAVKEFLMDVLAARADASGIPGLWSMVPASSYQIVNNRRDADVKSQLFVIAGDSQVGNNIGNTLLVIFTNLFYQNDNDFVVDTKSMKQGLSRAEGLYQYLSKDSNTNHFNYFKNDNTRRAIALALQSVTADDKIQFELISKNNIDRGVNLALEIKIFNYDNVTGNRPIAIMLPGIMGSTLKDSKDDLWLDFIRIARGHMVTHLNINAKDIKTSGAIAMYYKKLGEHLLKNNDLKVFAFDWRKKLSDAAAEFKNLLEQYINYKQPINIVAHSMGGLVVKHVMFHHPETWKKFIAGDKNKVFLLGTPWRGSHLILEVLTGHSSRVGQLNTIDLVHKKSTILKTVAAFPGVVELLPLDLSGFSDPSFSKIGLAFEGYDKGSFWDNIGKYAKDMIKPSPEILQYIADFKKKTGGLHHTEYDSFQIEESDLNKIYYLAGQSDTIFGCKIKDGFFTGERLVYLKTNLGDGSVTWDLGIPKELPKSNVYYSQISHTNLSNDKIIFEAIDDIIKLGSTNALPKEAPMSRGAELISEVEMPDAIADNDEEAMAYIFGDAPATEAETSTSQAISVTVYNADLKQARHPIMVGHFKDDGIYSAERSLDRYLKGKLSERHRLGYYPGEIGESEITYSSLSQPRGALVIGMGKLDELTPYRLTQSVEKAIIKYAFFFRDNYELAENKKFASGISSIIMGSAFAGMPIADCVQAVLTGVQRANDRILQLDNGLKTIKEIEFIDYYEDVAQQCYQILKKIENGYNSFNIYVQKFEAGFGSRRRLTLYDGASWWHTFNTTTIRTSDSKVPIGLSYSSTSGRARVEQNNISSDLKMVEFLSAEFSHKANWDFKLSKTMFELLIPNDFKSIIRNQSNIIWKMDEYAAQFPWEMFHDYMDEKNSRNDIPTFVNTGLIRQLITDKYRVSPVVVDKKKAIVIGDPDYSESPFGQLPGAADEAKIVSQIIKDNHYDTLSLINKSAVEIIKELYSDTYKMMHFAAHGVYEPIEVDGKKQFRAGIVLGNGIFLEPGTINQLSSIPEFIFINCCYSGTMTSIDENMYRHRPNLAANIGTQLIHMGVKAVVVTGWAVSDAAAKTFAKELYTRMFEGYEFGIAVQMARRKCYDLHPNNNTWGAYQCYGDHFYKLTSKNPSNTQEEPFVTANQAIIELENMLSIIQGQKTNVKNQLEHLEAIKVKVDQGHLENATIRERYAMVYAELGQYAQAVNILRDLLVVEQADFSVTSIEQYCSLRGKLLFDQARSIANKNNTQQEKVMLAELKKLFDDLEILSMLGNTSERLYLQASAYKRASVIDTKNKEAHLAKMRDVFKAAFNHSADRPIEDSVFSLSNYLIANSCLPAAQRETFENAGLKLDINNKSLQTVLSDIEEDLIKRAHTFKSYYKFNALAKILSCKFFIDWDAKATMAAKKKDIEMYFKAYRNAMMDSLNSQANIKNILGEKEHLDFLKELYKDDAIRLPMLESLSLEIEALLQRDEV